MSFMSEKRTLPLFVNSSQRQKYGCGPYTAVSDSDADHWRFSTVPGGGDVAAKQSSNTSLNDAVNYKADAVSPVFGRLKRPLTSLSSGSDSLTVGDSVRPVGIASTFAQRADIDNSSESEDSDGGSPVLSSRSRKRRRFNKCQIVIDSDDSDDGDGKAYKTSSSHDIVHNDSQQNKAVTENSLHKLPALQGRHCFDLLLNCKGPNAVTDSRIMQSLPRSYDEPLRKNNMCRHSVKSYSQSSYESVDRGRNCSLRVPRLQLRDVPAALVLSDEDKLSLSGECSSEVSYRSSTVNRDDQLSVSDDLNRQSKVGVDRDSVIQSADVQYCSSDDLFSDNELVESVCLSPSDYCKPDEQPSDIARDVSEPSDNNLESEVTCEQPGVTFVGYSQAEDDCILIGDSDDELFANLTQSDVTAQIKDECASTDDDDRTQEDADCVAAAASTDNVGERPATSAAYDPWITDVADVSSDELEEAYDAAMSFAHPAECDHSDSSTVSQQLDHCTTSPCRVSLKRLTMSDIPPEIRWSQALDVVVVDNKIGDDFRSDTVSESVSSKSISGKDSDADAVESVKDTAFDEWCTASRCGIFEKFNEPLSVRDAVEVTQNKDVKYKCDGRGKSARTALENCVEVAEFYGRSVTRPSKENRRHTVDSAAVRDTTKLDKVANTESRNSTGLHYTKKDQSHSTTLAPLHVKPRKCDTVRSRDDYAHDEEEWKSKASVQSFSEKTSSAQYQKIAQMRDCSKQKLRRDKNSFMSGRRLESDDCNDRFMGLSQFSVAKQQLHERNRQLKANGLHY